MLISIGMIPRSSQGYSTHFLEKVNSSQISGCDFVTFQSRGWNHDEQFIKLQQQMVHKFSKNLGARMVTCSKFHTQDQQILDATIQN
jgi:hypothetical protein